MVSLRDCVEIQTTPSQLFKWLGRMPQEYEVWHPDHVSCRIIQGSMLEVGSEVECQEYLHGKLHIMRFQMTKVVPDKRVEFDIEGIGHGAFEAQVVGENVLFMAELDIGIDAPIIGRFFDLVFSWLFKRRIAEMKQHMAEEGQNLKMILEIETPMGLDAA